MEDFVLWLGIELERRRWSVRQLAHQTGVSYTTMASIANGYTKPSADICQRIALVLETSPEEVFRQAGLLPPESREQIVLREVSALLRQLSPDRQDAILTFVRDLIEDQEGTRVQGRYPSSVAPP